MPHQVHNKQKVYLLLLLLSETLHTFLVAERVHLACHVGMLFRTDYGEFGTRTKSRDHVSMCLVVKQFPRNMNKMLEHCLCEPN